jgi:hypothetical protein
MGILGPLGRALLGWFAAVLATAGSGPASAQGAGSYPSRPVTVVIPRGWAIP